MNPHQHMIINLEKYSDKQISTITIVDQATHAYIMIYTINKIIKNNISLIVPTPPPILPDSTFFLSLQLAK